MPLLLTRAEEVRLPAEQDVRFLDATAVWSLTDALSSCYEFKDYTRVLGFLLRQPSLVGLLFEASAHIEEIFGPRATTSLEVVRDPDSPTGEESLLVLVHSGLEPARAMAALDRFDELWWTEANTTWGLVCIDVL